MKFQLLLLVEYLPKQGRLGEGVLSCAMAQTQSRAFKALRPVDKNKLSGIKLLIVPN